MEVVEARQKLEGKNDGDRRFVNTIAGSPLQRRRYHGVSWCREKGKYEAHIRYNGQQHYLGSFDSDVEAAKEYDQVAKVRHGINAKLNFLDEADVEPPGSPIRNATQHEATMQMHESESHEDITSEGDLEKSFLLEGDLDQNCSRTMAAPFIDNQESMRYAYPNSPGVAQNLARLHHEISMIQLQVSERDYSRAPELLGLQEQISQLQELQGQQPEKQKPQQTLPNAMNTGTLPFDESPWRTKSRARTKAHADGKPVFDWECIILFPYSSSQGVNKRNTKERYAKVMGGIKKWRRELMVDRAKQIFRTDRCYLSSDDSPSAELVAIQKEAEMEEDELKRAAINRKRIEVIQRLLMQEFVELTGGDAPISNQKWSELICKAVVKRLQLACGLTAAMKHSLDGDEVVCVIRADENDLKIEADRNGYKLQLNNKPFAYETEEAAARSCSHFRAPGYIQELRESDPDSYEKARARLRRTCDDRGEGIDPSLNRKGLQQRLGRFLEQKKHHEEFKQNETLFVASGDADQDCELDCSRLLPAEYSVYIAPYDEYRMEDEYQPFYRHYINKNGDYSPFRNIDRVRLTMAIIERHINVNYLEHAKYIKDYFPMHDTPSLEWLRKNWVNNRSILPFPGCQKQPIGAIREYFGEKVSIYFAWVEHYARSLAIPSALGVLFTFYQVFAPEGIQGFGLMAYCVLIGIWATTMTEFWKGENAFHNLCWGTTDFASEERERASFVGVVRYSPVNDMKEMYHISRGKLYRKISYSGGLLCILVLIAVAATYMCLFLKWYLVEKKEVMFIGVSVGGPAAGALNAVNIGVFNAIYTILAEYLTSWENHRTQSEYESHLVTKTFLFRFCNSYSSFFYIAFIKRQVEGRCLKGEPCMDELRMALASIFITQIVIGNLAEVLVPIVKFKLLTWAEKKAAKKKMKRESKKAAKSGREAGGSAAEVGGMSPDAGELDDHQYGQPELESKYEKYEEKESYQDYAEMVIQYGFVTLFVCAFPLTPLLALANNALELHVDAFKLCTHRKRPVPRSAESIGNWGVFMAVQSSVAVVTNLALVIFVSDLLEEYSFSVKMLSFVCFEHVLLVLKSLVQSVIPDSPEKIKQLVARQKHTTDKLFRGLVMENHDDKEEQAEALDLAIHPNVFSFAQQPAEVPIEAVPRIDFPASGVPLVLNGPSRREVYAEPHEAGDDLYGANEPTTTTSQYIMAKPMSMSELGNYWQTDTSGRNIPPCEVQDALESLRAVPGDTEASV
jgi:hypothetical protein